MSKIIQITCTNGRVYGLDENGALWSLTEHNGSRQWNYVLSSPESKKES
jgi:hypothetical protein